MERRMDLLCLSGMKCIQVNELGVGSWELRVLFHQKNDVHVSSMNHGGDRKQIYIWQNNTMKVWPPSLLVDTKIQKCECHLSKSFHFTRLEIEILRSPLNPCRCHLATIATFAYHKINRTVLKCTGSWSKMTRYQTRVKVTNNNVWTIFVDNVWTMFVENVWSLARMSSWLMTQLKPQRAQSECIIPPWLMD